MDFASGLRLGASEEKRNGGVAEISREGPNCNQDKELHLFITALRSLSAMLQDASLRRRKRGM